MFFLSLQFTSNAMQSDNLYNQNQISTHITMMTFHMKVKGEEEKINKIIK